MLLPQLRTTTNINSVLSDKYYYSWDQFEILHAIGEGKFARVYEAACDGFKNNIALRVLKLPENSVINQRKLGREVRQLVEFKHVNIVCCYEIVRSKVAYVLEFCVAKVKIDGEEVSIHTLLGLINTYGDDLPWHIRLNALKDILQELSYVHQKRFVVGDLKPSNVLVSTSWKGEIIFKLTDLNVSTKPRHSSLISSSYQVNNIEIVYTMLYLAPELLSNDLQVTLVQSVKTDIYAFSILMYQVLFPEVDFFCFSSIVQYLKAVIQKWRPLVPSFCDDKELPCDIYLMLISMMKQCWDESPLMRPTADQIHPVIIDCILSFEKCLSRTDPDQTFNERVSDCDGSMPVDKTGNECSPSRNLIPPISKSMSGLCCSDCLPSGKRIHAIDICSGLSQVSYCIFILIL